MTHRRKEFLVYPPNYKPGVDRFKIVKSVKAAKRLSLKMGHGASVIAQIHVHPSPRTRWQSSFGKELWTVSSSFLD